MTAKIACRHSLATVAGFRVSRTMRDGAILDRPVFVVRVLEATGYAAALEAADMIRRVSGSWAVIDTQYLCGCWSDDRDLDTLTESGGYAPGALESWSDEDLDEYDAGCILAEGAPFYGAGSPILRRAAQVAAEQRRRYLLWAASRPAAPAPEPSDAPF